MHLQTILKTYLAVTRHNAPTMAPRLQNCLRNISDFCGCRRLQLNEKKTEVMWFGSSASLHGLTATEKHVVIGNANVQPVDSVRNLGVHLDSLLDMHVHIAKTVQVCLFQLRRLRRVRRLLGCDVTANLVAALVFSRLDYGNALFTGLPDSSLAPYQRVINAAFRLVNGLRLHDHVTSAAIDLHWLSAEARCVCWYTTLSLGEHRHVIDLLQPVAATSSRRATLRT